jgi:endo-1,4-beta-xylanase
MTVRAAALVAALSAALAPVRPLAAQLPTGESPGIAAPTVTAAPTGPALKDVFKGAFRVGTAVYPRQFDERDKPSVRLIQYHFNTISPENVMKWEIIHPQPDVYNVGPADRYVGFGERNGMFVVGHTLVWHSQTPRWVFEDAAGRPLTRDALLARMREHIRIVVGRYKGRVGGWDVVNEALEEDGTLRQSPWLRIIGPDYIAKAFQYAHEADPGAELYYNDYSMERAAKRAGGVRLVKSLLDQGVRITGVGMQDHLKMSWPTVAEEDSTIAAFAALGVRVNISELDVDLLPPAMRDEGADVSLRAAGSASLDPYTRGLPDSVQRALAARYSEIFRVFLKHKDVIDRVTFWGLADGDSWLNGWPVRGRTSHPLLFDRRGRPKPAFTAVTSLVPTTTSLR